MTFMVDPLARRVARRENMSDCYRGRVVVENVNNASEYIIKDK